MATAAGRRQQKTAKERIQWVVLIMFLGERYKIRK